MCVSMFGHFFSLCLCVNVSVFSLCVCTCLYVETHRSVFLENFEDAYVYVCMCVCVNVSLASLVYL